MGKTPSGRAGIYLSYKTFTYHKKTLNIFFFIFWSLNREIYQGGVTLVGQKKNLFCCWLRICAFTGLPQCFSTSCKHFTFTFLPAASVSVTVACENCTENSLQCSHLEKILFPCRQNRSQLDPGRRDCSRATCLCFNDSFGFSQRRRFNYFVTHNLHFFPQGWFSVVALVGWGFSEFFREIY